MRKLPMAICLLILSVESFSQDTLVTYYDSSWKLSTPDKYVYYQKKIKSTDGWKVGNFYRSGKIQMTGTFNDEPGTIPNGEFIRYLENGDTSSIAHLVFGKLDGIHITFYQSGKRQVEGFYKMGRRDGDWIGYYESGKISGKAHYENGEQASAAMYNEDGSTNKTIKVFDKRPSFPGGDLALSRFLVKNLRYPEKAVVGNIQGTVVVTFLVAADGKLSDFEITKGPDESLNKEGLRVIQAMPNWEPAIRGGRVVSEQARQPIIFKLEDGRP